ncbi:hypothetical protein J6A31_07360 [bacterium]|nr:hypothetical protein [bacterium]
MARRKRKQRIYYNSSTDTWTNDAREQLSLIPQSNAYDDYQKKVMKQQEAAEKSSEVDNKINQPEKEKKVSDKSCEKDEIKKAYRKGEQGRAKYRKRMSKEVQVSHMQKVLSDGLDRHVSRHEFDDELHDDSILAREFPTEAAIDHKAEFDSKRELPAIDVNANGIIDVQEEPMTPGMKKLARYM